MRWIFVLIILGYLGNAFGQDIEPIEDKELVARVGIRIAAISYIDEARKAITTGSGILIDAKHVLTAAHVIENADPEKGMVVQIGALRNPVLVDNVEFRPFLTTGKVIAIDHRRDLAVLEVVNTFAFSKLEVCKNSLLPNSKFILASTSIASNSRADALQATWIPLWRRGVMEIKELPSKLPPAAKKIKWRAQAGDPILTLSQTLHPGDSGGAILGENGCLAGIVSLTTSFIVPSADNTYSYSRGVTIAMPINPGERLLSFP